MENQKREELENQKPRDIFKDKEVVFFKPKVIFNGECEHYYEEKGLDPEGIMQLKCKKCPMGKRHKKESYILVDGRIEYVGK